MFSKCAISYSSYSQDGTNWPQTKRGQAKTPSIKKNKIQEFSALEIWFLWVSLPSCILGRRRGPFDKSLIKSG